MKNARTAIVLNFILPGAGLWYLGQPGLGALNFLVALTFPLCGLFWWSEHVHYLFLAVAAGSAGLAHAAATRMKNSQDNTP